MTLILHIFFFGSLTVGGRSEIVSVDRTPDILPYEASGKITNTALVLGQPLCYFNTLSQVPCTQSTCEVWAAIASGPGITNFDADKLDPSLRILKASPYPLAFTSLSSKMYFVTKLGHPRDFPCGPLPGVRYFRIGAEGNCTTTNCNGILPLSSTISVTYILIDPVSKRVVAESKWSHSISLTSVRSWTSIDTWIWKRSGGMVVITVISSCLLALLLLMFGAVILLDCKGSFRGSHDIMSSPGIFRSLSN